MSKFYALGNQTNKQLLMIYKYYLLYFKWLIFPLQEKKSFISGLNPTINNKHILYTIVVILTGSLSPLIAQETTPQERGKSIFQKGISLKGNDVLAVMSGIDVPASVLPCSSCHGADGKGKPEGGVTPSNITWSALLTSFSGKRKNGRTHVPYSTKTLKRAITMGFDPSGNKLHTTMPQYKMTAADIADLVAYMQVLGDEQATGITDTTITIGWLPVIDKEHAKIATAEKKAIHAFFKKVNKEGGIYNRKIKLVEESATTPFAWTSSFLWANTNVPSTLNTKETPILHTISPTLSSTKQLVAPYSFSIYPNLQQQLRILANFLKKEYSKTNPIAIIIEENAFPEAIVNIFNNNASSSFYIKKIPPSTSDVQPILKTLEQQNIRQVLFLLQAPLEAQFFKAIETQQLPLEIILAGILTKTNFFELPPFFDNKISLIYPFWLGALSPPGKTSYQSLSQQYQLPTYALQAQLASLTTATLLVEGLTACGKDLHPEAFIQHLESLFRFATPYSPPLTFTKNRHLGSQQVFYVRFTGKATGLSLKRVLEEDKY